MTVVWLPFDPADIGDVPPGLDFDTYVHGAPPDRIEEVEFWVPHYGFSLPYGDLLPQMRSLQVIQTQSAGVEHVEPYVPEGVRLCNARGVHDAATAELAVALMLASLRGLPETLRAQDHGEWLDKRMWPSLADRRVLIVGHGSIGAALDTRLAGFECEVVKVARHRRDGVHPMTELRDLLPTADVVVLLVPLTDETHHLVDAAFLAAMKDDAVLVNVARGKIVDTDALLAVLATGRIHAALDVTDPEPLPSDHLLWSAPGVIITPHVAGGTTAMAPRIHRLVCEQLQRYVAGEPLINVVS